MIKNKIYKINLIALIYFGCSFGMEQKQVDNSRDENKQSLLISENSASEFRLLDNLPKEIVCEIINHALNKSDFPKALKTAKVFEKLGKKYRNLIYNDEIKKKLINLQKPLNLKLVALLYAKSKLNWENIKQLIINGANPNVRIRRNEIKNETALTIAVREGNREVVEFLLKHEAKINLKNDCNSNALTLASHNGHTEIIKLLANHGADLVNDGFYALIEVITSKMSDEEATAVFQLLLDLGANIEPTYLVRSKIIDENNGPYKKSVFLKPSDFETSILFTQECRSGIIKILASYGIQLRQYSRSEYIPLDVVRAKYEKFNKQNQQGQG